MGRLTFRGTDLQRDDRAIWFDLDDGFLALPSVRGEDLPIPGRPGRLVLSRIADRLVVPLTGWILGFGVEPGDLRPTYAESEAILVGLFPLDLDPGDLVASNGYAGLETDETATISVRTLNLVMAKMQPVPAAPAGFFRRISVELECVANPPAWAIEPVGS